VADPIRIFVGCAANGEDIESQIVLEYTLRKHATLPLEITWMQQSRDVNSPYYSERADAHSTSNHADVASIRRSSGWQTQKWATPFSGFRWALPAICKFEGKAIYMDSDFIVLADIAELWNTPMLPEKMVIAKGGNRYCCSLWDCAAVKPRRELMALMVDPDAHMKATNHWRSAPGSRSSSRTRTPW
jgi:hypothetical protein